MYVGILQLLIQKDFVPKKDDEFFPPFRRAARAPRGWGAKRGARVAGACGGRGSGARPRERGERGRGGRAAGAEAGGSQTAAHLTPY